MNWPRLKAGFFLCYSRAMNDTTVYRDYDQAALDAQYNNRARVLEHEDILAGYQARAEAVLEKFETRLDVLSWSQKIGQVAKVYSAG